MTSTLPMMEARKQLTSLFRKGIGEMDKGEAIPWDVAKRELGL